MAEQIIPEKACTNCKITYPITNYHKAKRGKYHVTATCKQCVSAYQKQPTRKEAHFRRNRDWRERNNVRALAQDRASYLRGRDKYLERAKVRYQERKSEIKRYLRAYYQSRADTIKAATAAWRRDNPVRKRIHEHTRRARSRSAAGRFTQEQWMSKCAYHGYRCYLCRTLLVGKALTVDHRIPLSSGGSNWIANIAPACQTCNSSKQGMSESEYRQTRLRVVFQV